LNICSNQNHFIQVSTSTFGTHVAGGTSLENPNEQDVHIKFLIWAYFENVNSENPINTSQQ
jgi:hypothetical protein